MNAVLTLVTSIFNLYIMIIILRLWLQFARADFYNPFSQFTVKATQPVIGPLRRLIPSIGSLDTATLVFAILVSFAKVLVYVFLTGRGLAPLFDALVIALLSLGNQFLWLIFWILVIRAILSWVSQGSHPMERVMIQLSEPMLSPIRRILPPMGGLDLSVLVFLLCLQFVINLYAGAFGPFL